MPETVDIIDDTNGVKGVVDDNMSVLSVKLGELPLDSTLDDLMKSFLQQGSKMPEVVDIINDANEVMDTWVMEVVEDNRSVLSVNLGDLNLDSTPDDFMNSYQQYSDSQEVADGLAYGAFERDERDDFKKEDDDIPPPPSDLEMRAALYNDRRGSQSRCF